MNSNTSSSLANTADHVNLEPVWSNIETQEQAILQNGTVNTEGADGPQVIWLTSFPEVVDLCELDEYIDQHGEYHF